MPRFIGEKIDVQTSGDIKQPVSLVWHDQVYQVSEIIASWFDWGFSAAAVQKNWRTRRHRNYFRLRTTSGEIFEIYLDRPPSSAEGEWFLYQVLDQ